MSPAEVKQQIALWDKNATDVEVISAGDTSMVGLTKSAAYRFPTTEDAVAIQLYEAALYKRLDNSLSVPTPQLIRMYHQPKCMVLSRLHGRHLTMAELARLPAEDLRVIIRQLLEFSITLNQTIDAQTVAELEQRYIADSLHERPWLGYFSKHLRDAQFDGQPWLEDLAHTQYAKWLDMVTASALPQIVVHDDLHNVNFLFEDGKVSGILDFGDATVGTIAQELRQLVRIHEGAVRMAIEEYAAMTGISVGFEEIWTWAVMQELAAYCRWLAAGDLKRPSFVRSRANLRLWLDGFKG